MFLWLLQIEADSDNLGTYFPDFQISKKVYGIQCHCQLLSVNKIQQNRVVETPNI